MKLTETKAVEMAKLLKNWRINVAPNDGILRIAALLDAWDGFHHLEIRKSAWEHDHVLLPYHQDLSTHDHDMLTRLVVLAHHYGVRVQVSAKGMSRTVLVFHARKCRQGPMSQRHPSLADLLVRIGESGAGDMVEDEPATTHPA